MNKQRFLTLLCFLSLLIALFFYSRSAGKSDEKIYSIAVVSPSTHPSLKAVEEGFKEALLATPHAFSFRFYRGGQGAVSMPEKIENMSSRDFDLILTIGAEATERSLDNLHTRNKQTPVVFTGLPLQSKEKLAAKWQRKQTTGVVEVADYPTQLRIMRMIRPNMRSLTVVYDENNLTLAEDVDEILSLLEPQKTSLHMIGIKEIDELEGKLSQLEDLDVVLVLKDNFMIDHLDQLVLFCNRKKVPLFTTELDSVNRGAAVGYGVIERSFGEEAAKRAYQILIEKKKPSEVAIGPVDQFYVLVNDAASHIQGLMVAPEVLETLRQEGF